ncbi:hypothetical protein AB0C10_16215 [Microbispora amethystogenes]|uniref:hypothetical protein n=1 Tax=Microbispora amethystogenes TaxID=1427754 RepID=UPI003401A657
MPRRTSTAAAEVAPVTPAGTQATQRTRTAQATRIKKPKPTVTLGVRLDYHVNERLTAATEKTGLGPGGVVEAAINDYCNWLGIPEIVQPFRNPDGSKVRREPAKRRTRRHREEIDDVRLSPRVSVMTDERLTYACIQTGNGPKEVVEAALTAWFVRNGVPNTPRTPGQRQH